MKNFTGYPARIVRGAGGHYWLAFFALRTQLTEFILREHAFRTRMMANVPPHLWVGPTLGGAFDYREPTQIGRIKKLGIQKPWAPPRSYGLVARLDAEGMPSKASQSNLGTPSRRYRRRRGSRPCPRGVEGTRLARGVALGDDGLSGRSG